MTYQSVPLAATLTERLHGIDRTGHIIGVAVYRHRRRGHQCDMYYIVQYREVHRRIQPGSRITREFTGPEAPQRAERAMREVRPHLAEYQREQVNS